jgi:hypothetical protein
MTTPDLERVHTRMLEVSAMWSMLEGSADWFTRLVAQRLQARGIDPYDATFPELAAVLFEAQQSGDYAVRSGNLTLQEPPAAEPKLDG